MKPVFLKELKIKSLSLQRVCMAPVRKFLPVHEYLFRFNSRRRRHDDIPAFVHHPVLHEVGTDRGAGKQQRQQHDRRQQPRGQARSEEEETHQEEEAKSCSREKLLRRKGQLEHTF